LSGRRRRSPKPALSIVTVDNVAPNKGRYGR
jgi:hypothetical protein